MSHAFVLVVDDEPDIRELVQDILEDEGYEVAVAENGEAARSAFADRVPDLVLLDIWMPDVDGITLLREWSKDGEPACPVVVMSGHGNLETAVEATRLGAHDFVQKPISLAKLLSICEQAIDSGRKRARPATVTTRAENEPVGNSAVMQMLRSKAEQAADHELPVLITGEKGSGRENLARFIHAGANRDGAFVILDHRTMDEHRCSDYLLDNDSGEGLLTRAAGGTLFIPDLQELPAEAISILQRFAAGNADSPAACRIMASAAEDILERVSRDDPLTELYYLLNVLPLHVPPLRERPEDVPDLVRHYAEWFPNVDGLPYRPFSVAAQNRLRNHDWPGNVRELRNIVQRLLVLGGSGEVSVDEVEAALARKTPPAPGEGAPGLPGFFDLPLREAREQFEREYLVFKLKEAEGSVGKLADAVGMERTHLYRKLRALGIDPRTAGRTEK